MFLVRADEEKLGGIIHKAMFERLLLCAFAVADLTTSNPNVMYELEIRHAALPRDHPYHIRGILSASLRREAGTHAALPARSQQRVPGSQCR